MDFVHIADMHFDTAFSQLATDNCMGTVRRLDQRNAFKKIIDFIKENNVQYLFIAGDFYEHQYIRESTIEYVNNLFKEIPNTKIFITPGNHDPYLINSFYNKYSWNDNVKIFGPTISVVETEEADIYGYGFNDFYYTNSELDTLELKNKSKMNILITHGTLDGTNNVDRQYNAISRTTLNRIGFDYVALGHIHKSNYTENEKIVYPGSTVALGFDEPGKHGFVYGKTVGNTLQTKYIAVEDEKFKTIELDITEELSIDDLAIKINSLMLDDNKYYEIYLVR